MPPDFCIDLPSYEVLVLKFTYRPFIFLYHAFARTYLALLSCATWYCTLENQCASDRAAAVRRQTRQAGFGELAHRCSLLSN